MASLSSNAYVNDAKEATYEPWVFSLLAELASVAVKIKKELEKRKMNYPIMEYGFQEKYKSTEAYRKVVDISYKTDITKFPATWDSEQEARLQELRKKNQIEAIKAQLKQIEQEDKNLEFLIKYFTALDAYFGSENWRKLISAQKEWKEAEKIRNASQLLFSGNASEIDANSVTADSWKKLWQYARKYSEEILEKKGEVSFATIGSKCPLCRQEILDKSIANRMESIDAYVNGKAAETEQNRYKKYENMVKTFPKIKTSEEFSILLDSAGIKENVEAFMHLHDNINAFSNTISGDLKGVEIKQILVKPYLEELITLKKDLNKKYESINALIDVQAQKMLEQQILEVEAEQYLVSIHEMIKKNIENLGKIKAIEQAVKLTATNKITSKSKSLAEEMITADYVRRFENELQELTKSSIAVKLSQQRAGRGKIPYKVVLCDVNGNQIAPQDILSEGENRVTALAAFFAEASGRSENTPLIVDDPISSLDYTYEAKVINRLVRAALNRQVIVFTHRISMVVGIYEKTREIGVNYQEISLLSSNIRKGVPSENSNIGGKVKSQINKVINGKLSKLKNLDEFSEEYKSLFHNTCQEFRNIVEKSVEDVLIGEVVKRFRKDIQTKGRLMKLASITEEDCHLIDRLMTRYSYDDHSMSDETPLQELSLDELEKDIIELKNWIERKSK